MLDKFVAALVLVTASTSVATAGSSFSLQSFGTKTKYWDQRDSSFALALQASANASTVQASDLELVQLQQVSRHGSRYPTKGNMGEISDLLDKLQINYSSVIPDWIKNYSLPYDSTDAGELAPAGFQELVDYGTRVRASVGSVIPTAYNASLFKLAHTSVTRTGQSAQAFASTFFSNPEDVEYVEYPDGSDPLLRFFDECDRYNAEVLDNSSALLEYDEFQASAKMDESIVFLKSQLNLPGNANLSATDVAAAFSACAFDVMLYNVTNEWCSLVDQTFLNHLEYSDELETFYEQGPGYKINYEISAILLQDIYAYMKNFTTGDTSVVGNLRFAHAETTLPLMTLLGYGDHTKLLASWTDEQIDSRGFRSSYLAPTASNIDFRLYRSKIDQQYFVSVWIQEVEAPLPGCDGALYCEFSKVEEIWGYYINDYNFEAECAV
ncbi:Multiple inositol polyphosphate phosphatase 1 [Phytophthora cinnamomi]|uniref:Multiple inositol polyphosphate phosphatase 1 n=1 Tax=Phytophthora cinnamomi TaxID=4785 RepID=UPI00355941A6|nr:Multiple inositol polyphosphate phosphatase 1 [Phytophthora cinnamomi]